MLSYRCRRNKIKVQRRCSFGSESRLPDGDLFQSGLFFPRVFIRCIADIISFSGCMHIRYCRTVVRFAGSNSGLKRGFFIVCKDSCDLIENREREGSYKEAEWRGTGGKWLNCAIRRVYWLV